MERIKFFTQRAIIGLGCGLGVFLLIQGCATAEAAFTVKTHLFYTIYLYASIAAGCITGFYTAVLWD